MENYTKDSKEISRVALAMRSKPNYYISEGNSLEQLTEKIKDKFKVIPKLTEDIIEMQTIDMEIAKLTRERLGMRQVFALEASEGEIREEIKKERYPRYEELAEREYEFENEHLPGGRVKRKLKELSLIYEPAYCGD